MCTDVRLRPKLYEVANEKHSNIDTYITKYNTVIRTSPSGILSDNELVRLFIMGIPAQYYEIALVVPETSEQH